MENRRKMIKEQISNNVSLTILPSDKFKRNRISINLIVPNVKEKATLFSILPSLMERAYEDYPNMQAFSKKLSQMYGASLDASSSVIGRNRSLRFTVQGIKDEFCIDNESLLAEMCDVLLGVIFRPCTENGAFVSEWLEVEKVKLKEEIEGEINDKRSYCVKNAQRKFFANSLNGVERLGYLEEIDDITPQQLFDCYQEVIKNSVVHIYLTASNPESIKPKLAQAFSSQNKGASAVLPIELTPCKELEIFEEKMDIVQGKVCLIYTTQRALRDEERYQMLVASSLFGGTASSRLFKNVREKLSLCYYCAAGFNGFTSSLRVDSGVEHKNMQKTIDAIKNEMQQLIEGEISEKEIDETKLVIINSLKTIYDGINGLEAWYLNEAIHGTAHTPEQVVEKVKSVTKEQIKDVLKLLNLNIIYKLTEQKEKICKKK